MRYEFPRIILPGNVLAAMLFFAGGPAMAQPATPAVAQPATEAASEDETLASFTIEPLMVEMQSRVTFNREYAGQDSGYLNISFRAYPSTRHRLARVSGIKVEHAITDQQERLVRTSNSRDFNFSHWSSLWSSSSSGRDRGIQMFLQFQSPLKPARRLVEMKGTIEATIVMGEPIEVVAKPFAQITDRRILFKELPGEYLVIRRVSSSEFTQPMLLVEMTRGLESRAAKLVFEDEAGRPLEARYQGDNSNPSSPILTSRFSVDMPDRGQVRLSLYPRSVIREFPFVMKDLPLVPSVRDAGREEILLELRPAPGNRQTPLTPVVKE